LILVIQEIPLKTAVWADLGADNDGVDGVRGGTRSLAVAEGADPPAQPHPLILRLRGVWGFGCQFIYHLSLFVFIHLFLFRVWCEGFLGICPISVCEEMGVGNSF